MKINTQTGDGARLAVYLFCHSSNIFWGRLLGAMKELNGSRRGGYWKHRTEEHLIKSFCGTHK